MVNLNDEQYQELTDLLGHNPDEDGEWAIVNDPGPCIYAINSRGTIVVRLTCVDKAGRQQKPRKCCIREFYDHYLFCNLNGKDVRLHRAMAATWLDDWDKSLTVNHKDGNKHNNSIENLEMLTVHDNCLYYHTADCIQEQRERDYAYHGETIKGRIHITNGTEARMIRPDEEIPEGWWRGRPQSMKDHVSASQKGSPATNRGKILITDGEVNRYVDPSEEVPEGWRRGSCIRTPEAIALQRSSIMTNRIFIHKGEENIRVYKSELDSYLAAGWVKGRSPGLKEHYRERLSDRMKGENNPFYGKKHTAESLEKMSAAHKGKSVKHTEEAKRKISESKKGYHHTEEAKRKISESKKGRPGNNKGHIWITNGSDNKQILEEDLYKYPGYRKGITREKIERTYVNDGVTNHKIPVAELNEWLSRGYVRGLLKKTNNNS